MSVFYVLMITRIARGAVEFCVGYEFSSNVGIRCLFKQNHAHLCVIGFLEIILYVIYRIFGVSRF